jgi:hypothetical protein
LRITSAPTAGGGSGDLDGLVAGAAGSALLTGTAQVEQRVIDAHGHADEQDDLEDAVADGRDLADGADEAERRQDAADGQQHRDAGGDERAEGDEQQRERERQRRRGRLAHVVLEDLVEGLLGCCSTERLDAQIRVILGDGAHGGGRGLGGVLDLLVVDLPRDGVGQHGRVADLGEQALALGGVRVHDLGNAGDGLQPFGEVGGRGAEARVVVLEVVAGQQDHLALLLLVGLLVGLVGVTGLADAEL